MTAPRAATLALATLAALSSTAARAQTAPPLPKVVTATAAPDRLSELERGWPERFVRFRASEYGVTAALGVGLIATTLLIPKPPTGWKGETALDRGPREALRAESRETQDRLSLASDVLQNAAILVPVLVDIGIGALALRQDLDLALQMALIDIEVLILATSVVTLSKRAFGRVRPEKPMCADGTFACHSNTSRRSLISGHSSAAFTAAGLSCVHHRYLQLFGRGLDEAVCAVMLATAASTAVLRVAADKHWLTDTLAGAVTGLVSGYAVPYLLHYQGESTWPGRGDRELDGHLTLGLFGGVTWGERRAGAAVGLDATARALLHVARPLRLELSGQGRLLLDNHGFAVRDVLTEGRLWLGPVGLGGAARYRALDGERPSQVGWSAGPTLSFGTFDEANPWLLTLRWLPAGQGALDQFGARIEWAPWRHVILNLEVSPFVYETQGERLVGASAVIGAGGRLPW